MTDLGNVSINRTELAVAGDTVDGWVAEIEGTTGTGHSREGALRNLAEALWRETL